MSNPNLILAKQLLALAKEIPADIVQDVPALPDLKTFMLSFNAKKDLFPGVNVMELYNDLKDAYAFRDQDINDLTNHSQIYLDIFSKVIG